MPDENGQGVRGVAIHDAGFVMAGWLPYSLGAVAVAEAARYPPEEERQRLDRWMLFVAVTFVGWLAYLRSADLL